MCFVVVFCCFRLPFSFQIYGRLAGRINIYRGDCTKEEVRKRLYNGEKERRTPELWCTGTYCDGGAYEGKGI